MCDVELFKGLSILIEKRKRNLEKKKNKLDDLKTKQKNGDHLNEDQIKSLSTYASVVYALENVKDLYDQSVQMAQDIEKTAKKQAKKQSKDKTIDFNQIDSEFKGPEDVLGSEDAPPVVEPHASGDARVDTSHLLIRNMVLQYKIQEVLSDLGTDEIRQCFASGIHGAIKLSSAELDFLDALYPHINPARESLSAQEFEERILAAARHCTYLFECKEMDISEVGTTYDILHDLFSRILASDFYVNGRHSEVVVSEAPESNQTAPVMVNGGEVHSTVNPNAAEFYPRGQSSQSSNVFNAETNVYENYSSNDYFNYSQPTSAPNANGPPYQPLSKVIEPLQSNFNFLQISEVDSGTGPTIVTSRDHTSNEVVTNTPAMIMSQPGPATATANQTTTKPSVNNTSSNFYEQNDTINYSELATVPSSPPNPPGLSIMQPAESNLTSCQSDTVPVRVESSPVSSWAQLLKKNVPANSGRIPAVNLSQQAPTPADNLYQPYQKVSSANTASIPTGDDAGEDVFSKATDSQFLNKDNDGWISSSKPHHNRANKSRGNALNSKDNQPSGPPNARNGFRGRPSGRGGNANTQFGTRGGHQGAVRGGFSANTKQAWS